VAAKGRPRLERALSFGTRCNFRVAITAGIALTELNGCQSRPAELEHLRKQSATVEPIGSGAVRQNHRGSCSAGGEVRPGAPLPPGPGGAKPAGAAAPGAPGIGSPMPAGLAPDMSLLPELIISP